MVLADYDLHSMKNTPQHPKILLSFDSLRGWRGAVGIGTFLKSAVEIVDGFELTVSYDDLRSWESGLRLGIKVLPPPHFDVSREITSKIFQKSANALRLSPLKYLPAGREIELARDIQNLLKNIKIERVVVDVSEVSSERVATFASALPDSVELVQINCEPGSFGFGIEAAAALSQSLKDLTAPSLLYLKGPGQVFDSHDHFSLLELVNNIARDGHGAGFVYSLPIQSGDHVHGLGELVRLAEMVHGKSMPAVRRSA